jgi:hypothetical protein
MASARHAFESLPSSFTTLILGGLAVAVVLHSWIERSPMRLPVTIGLAAIAWVLVRLWRWLEHWSRPQLLAAYLAVGIAGLVLYHGPEAAQTLRIGPLDLVDIVNLLVLYALVLGAVVVLRSAPPGSFRRRILACVALLLILPHAIALVLRSSLPELLAGPAWTQAIPLGLRPTSIALCVILPLFCVFLMVDLIRSLRRREQRSTRLAFCLVRLLASLTIGAKSLASLSQDERGLAERRFTTHAYSNLGKQEIVPESMLVWDAGSDAKPSPFWAEWEGFLWISRADAYTFAVQGTGAAFLYLDGRRIIDVGARDGSVELERGQHRVRVGVIEEQPSGSIDLRWRRSNESELAPIPARLWSHDAEQRDWRRTPRQAAQVAVEWLQSAAVDWQRAHQCFGCHVQAHALMGLSIAERGEYRVNAQYFGLLHGMLSEPTEPFDTLEKQQYAAMALAHADSLRGIGGDETLEATVGQILTSQQPDGAVAASGYLPFLAGPVTATTNSLFGIAHVSELTGREDLEQAAARATAWLLSATHRGHAGADPQAHRTLEIRRRPSSDPNPRADRSPAPAAAGGRWLARVSERRWFQLLRDGPSPVRLEDRGRRGERPELPPRRPLPDRHPEADRVLDPRSLAEQGQHRVRRDDVGADRFGGQLRYGRTGL